MGRGVISAHGYADGCHHFDKPRTLAQKKPPGVQPPILGSAPYRPRHGHEDNKVNRLRFAEVRGGFLNGNRHETTNENSVHELTETDSKDARTSITSPHALRNKSP